MQSWAGATRQLHASSSQFSFVLGVWALGRSPAVGSMSSVTSLSKSKMSQRMGPRSLRLLALRAALVTQYLESNPSCCYHGMSGPERTHSKGDHSDFLH